LGRAADKASVAFAGSQPTLAEIHQLGGRV